jgi:hypothetical protein
MTNQLLEIDVRLLVLRYGRQRILKVLARLGEQTPEDLERQLQRVEQRPNAQRATKPRQSLSDVLAVECRERPELAEPLRAIAVNFENRTFLPHLRDVQRFLDRMGASQHAKSRAETGPALIRALSKLKREELVMLAARAGSARESDYSLLSRAIMGAAPAKPRDEE